MNTHKIFNLVMALIFAVSLLGMPAPALAQEPLPNPVVAVYPADRQVFGWSWTSQAAIQVSAGSCSASTVSDSSGNFYIQFGESCHLQAGDTVTTSDGITTKGYMIASLLVTDADAESDTVYGTAEPGSNIQVWICDSNGCINRHETPDENRNWSANFSVYGDEPGEQNTFELQPGHQGEVVLHESDGNATSIRWRIPKPILWGVTASNNWISGIDWAKNTTVQISIDNPSTPQNPDSTTTQNTDTNGNFSYQSQYDISVGSVISVTDGYATKHVTVSDFQVLEVDWESDTISGIGTPNANAAIWLLNWQEPFVIDSSGHWQVNLAGKKDITTEPEDQGFAIEQDNDGDGTQSNWSVPRFHANPGGYANNHIDGFGWPAGSTVFLTIEDPSTTISPDYSASVTVSNNDPWQTNARFTVQGFDLSAGHVVTLTGSSMTKSLVVKTLQITEANAMSDVVRGIAEPDSVVRVNLWCRDCPIRVETADSNGNWIADFSMPGDQAGEVVYDIPAGLQIGALQFDNDNDATRFDLLAPNPHLLARLPDNAVVGREWPLGTPVTLSIDDPTTPEQVDYTDTRTVEVREWDPNQTEVRFDIDNFLLEPGQVLTMTDGIVIKIHTIIDLKTTDVNIDSDTVSGTTNVFAGKLRINLFGASANFRTLTPNPDGSWFADFSVPHSSQNKTSDIKPGDVTETLQYDVDGDFTLVRWRVPIDIDRDGITDVLDPCPDDATNTCNVAGSAAGVIGVDGGVLATGNGKVTLSVPPESLGYDVTLSITDMGGGYELASDQGLMMVVHSYSIQPNGTQFDPPASITFRWDDADNNGIVDGTTAHELNLQLIKDGLVITPACSANSNCNMAANELTVQVSDLSLFALAVPIEWTLKGFYQPVDMNGVYNIVKGGSTVPLKFEIFAGTNELADIAYIKSLTYAQTSCDANAVTDEVETTATGGTSLRYADGQFIYNWKTPKSAGKCYRVTMTTMDGSSLVAYFRLK